MVDDLVATEATGRGQRIRKPRKIFVATPTTGKRKRAAIEEDAPITRDPITGAPLLSKKRAKTRDASVVPTAPVAPAPAGLVKRKHALDDEAASTTLPPTDNRATGRTTSTAPQRITPATSRAAFVPPSRAAPALLPRTITRATSRAPSAASLALKAEAESSNENGKAKKRACYCGWKEERKGEGEEEAEVEAEVAAEGVTTKEEKGEEKGLDPVQDKLRQSGRRIEALYC